MTIKISSYCSNTLIFKYVIIFLILATIKKVKCECDKELEWDCDSGECIDIEGLCNGKVECADGSDEIAENCVGRPCPSVSFRCTYGGCVAGTDKCDGIKNCADNSDEMPLLCANEKELEQLILQQQGNCTEGQYKCRSGECIDRERICDGPIDCSDSSDEIVDICSTAYCQTYAFRCGYGGCISGSSKCNNKRNCHDGSDEAAHLCGEPRKTNVITVATPVPPRKDFAGADPFPVPAGAGCTIPMDRAHLIVTRVQSKVKLLPGQVATVNSIVSYKCDPTYNLVGVNGSFCETSGWNWDVPFCTKYCSRKEVSQGFSTYVTLTYENTELKENDPIPPGTVATFRCAFGYTALRHTTLRCTDKAKWDRKKPTCSLDCGLVTPKITAFAKNGRNTSITEVPWHVGIYSKFKTNTFDHICGGTIIAAKLVISAAHCFWDGANGNIFDASYYQVGAGKYFRDYKSTNEPFDVQKVPIKNIHVEMYNDLTENYRNDIAVLILEKFLTFTHSIKPICMEFLDRENQKVNSQLAGLFAGWGITNDNSPSTVLQTVSMTTLSYSDCTNTLKDKQNSYKLPDDKFCISNMWGGTACRGDSGGGFVIKRPTQRFLGSSRYFLIGIISHAPVQAQDCGKDTVVALTNIQYFKMLIEKNMAEQEYEEDDDIT